MEKIKSFQRYNSDSGTGDFSSKKRSLDIPFEAILKEAVDLGALQIVKTSHVNEKRPGAWYIKAYSKHCSYETIKLKIEHNSKNGVHSKRICWLLEYQPKV
jgi:hypothetical protein